MDTIPIRSSFPAPPSTLGDAGKQAWKRGDPLWRDGSLVERDLAAWQAYCEAIDEVDHCRAVVASSGEYQRSKNGAICQHPAINRRMHAEKTIFRLAKCFGLMPDARKKRPAIQQGVATRKRS